MREQPSHWPWPGFAPSGPRRARAVQRMRSDWPSPHVKGVRDKRGARYVSPLLLECRNEVGAEGIFILVDDGNFGSVAGT